jgi:phage tail tape-measure protein
MPNFSIRGGFGGEGYGIGASLASYGADQKRQAMLELGSAAEQENARNIKNQQLSQAEKQGKIQLGSTLGAMGGMAAGTAIAAGGAAAGAASGAAAGSVLPGLGTLIGGALGALAGGLFSR